MKFSIDGIPAAHQEKELVWSLEKAEGVVSLVVKEKGSDDTWHVFGVKESNGTGFLYTGIPIELDLTLDSGNEDTITLTEEE